MAFLTSMKQEVTRNHSKENWALDDVTYSVDVTSYRSAERVNSSPREGVYVDGLFMEGARWDVGAQIIDKSQPKEMYVQMPIITCRAVPADKAESSGIFMCPVYKTQFRGPTYVFSAQLKTKSPPARWVLASCALILDVGV